jgi:DNA-binding FadR family transcriptional regulator
VDHTITGGTEIKAAQRVARTIEEEILVRGLDAGAWLASEPELIERFGLSRAIIREAVRILEHEGIARMRRGPGGGLFVVAPDSKAVSHSAALWLRFNRAELSDLSANRELIESHCAGWAAQSITEEGAALIREAIERERLAVEDFDRQVSGLCSLGVHEAIAQVSGNKVSYLFVMALCELNAAYAAAPIYTKKEFEETVEAHLGIHEAILAGDSALASHRMIVHLRAGMGFTDWPKPRSQALRRPNDREDLFRR